MMFQSTFPRGERLVFDGFHLKSRVVSIHVPARGTTAMGAKLLGYMRCFNPRSREGNDTSDIVGFWLNNGFNPRSREGNDHSAPLRPSCTLCFNPRSREGNDVLFPLISV